jgi:hypothetical protein
LEALAALELEFLNFAKPGDVPDYGRQRITLHRKA